VQNWFFEQLAMYAAYHRDPRNQATHHVGVPMIVFSLLVLTATIDLMDLGNGSLSLAAVLIAMMLMLYLLNAPLIGIIAILKYGVLLYLAEYLAKMGHSIAISSFAVLFVVGWAIQFWGHIYEGRKPALFDNLTQVFMAPAFLIAEVLFKLGLGDDLKEEITARSGKYDLDITEAPHPDTDI